ncbi:hypothetical protein EMPS_03502 [Entomortierella parvispora]|uniref:Uncharacterized protein n=1 Tax=Entomortierella parvispora TaxID=205924 RepID=A0A9P3LUN1_9FUNG|nr:hypothetical protein EMPS_03502 [Entomortierella parvispora]
MAHTTTKRLASQRSSPPLAPSASGPSPPRLQPSSLADIAAHRPYHSQPRLASTSSSNTTTTTTTTTASSKNINIINNNKSNSNHTNPSNINGYMITSAATSRTTSPTPASAVKPGNAKHVHTLSSNICYPHPSTHPPLRLLTTATCLDTLTSLISAQSPPHSPTFSSFAVPQSTGSRNGSTSSRANSILDGIQNALGAASSPPTAGSIKQSSSYSAAKDSLADFSIAASKRGSNNGSNKTGTSKSKYSESGGVIRSNYVSFPNFDDIDFVDVAMVDDDEEEEDQNDWSGPDSPPEGQRSMMDNNGHINNSLDEKSMRSIYQSHPVGFDPEMRRAMENGISMGMPTRPSDQWLLQLETYHELRVNGSQV